MNFDTKRGERRREKERSTVQRSIATVTAALQAGFGYVRLAAKLARLANRNKQVAGDSSKPRPAKNARSQMLQQARCQKLHRESLTEGIRAKHRLS